MDQTPLPFVLDDGKTYADKGSSEVWCVSGSSGLDKRQCSVQLTIFADGVPRVRPLVIFRGKGLRITRKEQEAWDRRVQVAFQPKAWCDESMMKKWISEQWGNIFINPPTTGSTGKILVADVHRAQQTDGVKALLKKKNTKLVNVPPGCTSRVQPLDVSFNKPFKDVVRQQFEKHLEENLQRYTEGKISASERRVLVTKWVGKAWAEVGSNCDMVVRSFKKCDISLYLDGSENGEIHIESIEEYNCQQLMK